MKVLALDYDDTFTADPELWCHFIKAAQARGHLVVCVTFRDEAVHGSVTGLPSEVEVFYTSGELKAAYMLAQGVMPNIWIDDLPHLIGTYPI